MSFNRPLPSYKQLDYTVHRADYADTFYNRLKKEIADAEAALKEGQSLSLEYSSPSGDRVTVRNIGFRNPNLIMLYGSYQRGNDCTVLAHMESLQLIHHNG